MVQDNNFQEAWNSASRIIVGETKVRNGFSFVEGTPIDAQNNDRDITINFCNDEFGKGVLGRTGYLKNRPRLVQLVKDKVGKFYYNDIIHNYAHELVHVILSKLQINPDNITKDNSCDMFNETVADLFADLGLHTFNSKFSNSLTIDEMLRTPYKNWSINSKDFVSGYRKFTPVTQLLILAFQNENINYQELCTKQNLGLGTPIDLPSGQKLNDFLYGITYDASHIANTWDRFMSDKISFADFSTKCNSMFNSRHDSSQDINETIDIMKNIAEFANRKNGYNFQNGFITKESNDKLRYNFNTLWNSYVKDLTTLPNRTGQSLDD